jgi:hypothetical protein
MDLVDLDIFCDQLVDKFSFSVRDKFFRGSISESQTMEKAYYCGGISYFHGKSFGPFGQMFNKYQNVFVSSWYYWQGSNYVYSPSLEDVSRWWDWL